MMDNQGAVTNGFLVINNRSPTIEAHDAISGVKALKDLWMKNTFGDITLQHGNAFGSHVIANVIAG
jgi:hypothetical protein